MKSKAILGMFLALFALAFAVSTVSAYGCNGFACLTDVEVDGISYALDWLQVDDDIIDVVVAGEAGKTIPVEVKFLATEDMDDVKVKVYIEGYKSEISDSTERFHVLEGNTYRKSFNLKLPSTMDLDDLDEEILLFVRVTAKGEDSLECSLPVNVQRELYHLNVLSIDSPTMTTAGSSIPVEVVVENNGNDRLENVYVKASIPELGIQRKMWIGDLDPEDSVEAYCDIHYLVDVVDDGEGGYYYDYDSYDECIDNMEDDLDDTKSVRIYLTLPKGITPGDYNLEVEAYNVDTAVMAKKRIAVDTTPTGVYSAESKAVAPGEETTFEVTLVNPSEDVAVYTITPAESTGLIIEVLEPVVVVPSKDSKTVKVKVKATESADEGTHVVSLNVNSDGELVTTKQLTVNVEESAGNGVTIGQNSTVFILTVVLVIIFVVLLIILIVLLTKRPEETEEVSETSYY